MPSTSSRSCPLCNSADLVSIGPILHPHPNYVAGVEIDLGMNPYLLRRCSTCGFQFKDPPIDAKKLMACYAMANSDHWELDPCPSIRRFDMLRDMLEKHVPGRRVLDVGCFNGALLDFLGDDWEKFGVEPSVKAAEVAEERGVRILASCLEEVDASCGTFDAVLAIDVVEHIVDPMPFFRLVWDRLVPGGVLLVLTGNTGSLAWRMQQSMYWYCSLPEHVSFYNRSAVDAISELLGMRCIDFRQVRHNRESLRRWTSDAIKSIFYVVGRRVGGLNLPPLRRWCIERRGPSLQSTKDHLVCVIRKA